MSRRDDAVTEPISAILTFAIVAMIFMLSMITFDRAQRGTNDRILELTSESAASRVSSVLVHGATFMESHGSTVRARYLVELPVSFDGRAYEVELVVPASDEAYVEVRVPSRGVAAKGALLSIEASTVELCASEVGGGPLHVRYGPSPQNPAILCLYLEPA